MTGFLSRALVSHKLGSMCSLVQMHSAHLGRSCLKIKGGMRHFDETDMFSPQRLVLKDISFRNFLLTYPQ